eukprot:Lithocolla_globosa_v1_NODE_456_length_3997_cov_19.695840.p4 type:complete len:103 gc:universal NODE_456_length_3997_cov_19.695840:375-683(+)
MASITQVPYDCCNMGTTANSSVASLTLAIPAFNMPWRVFFVRSELDVYVIFGFVFVSRLETYTNQVGCLPVHVIVEAPIRRKVLVSIVLCLLDLVRTKSYFM